MEPEAFIPRLEAMAAELSALKALPDPESDVARRFSSLMEELRAATKEATKKVQEECLAVAGQLKAQAAELQQSKSAAAAELAAAMLGTVPEWTGREPWEEHRLDPAVLPRLIAELGDVSRLP
ncbi:MAG: hypothetical protein U0840_24805 [Gemmataceae bacterium]